MFSEDTIREVFSTQFDTLWIVLERPVVQRQIGVSVAIILLAWLLPRLLRWLWRPMRGRAIPQDRSIGSYLVLRTLRASGYTFFPLCGILASRLSIRYFIYRDWRYGLIEWLLPLFWLLLMYRVLLAAMHAILQEKPARTYQQHVLTPLFVIVVALVVGNNFSSAFSLDDLRLFSLSDVDVSFGALFRSLLIFYFFMTVAWLVKDLLTKVVMPRVTNDMGALNAVVVSSYYVILVFGILSAAGVLGLDLTTLAIIGGGLTVGIGFGMQDLVNNFISGILLLFERTLRPGDMVEVNGQRGVVEQLRMRSTILRTVDNVEIIVPNKTFLSSNVSTYTQSDRIVRRTVAVGVSYNSNPTEVRDVLLAIADRHGLVLDKPEPVVHFSGFGESSLDFELSVFMEEPLVAPRVMSDLRFMIWNEFSKHKIEIPFPQRDLNVRSGIPWDELTAAAERRAPSAERNGHEEPEQGSERATEGGASADGEALKARLDKARRDKAASSASDTNKPDANKPDASKSEPNQKDKPEPASRLP